jgi:formylglycine-generating enzyme required for sulfatase activity
LGQLDLIGEMWEWGLDLYAPYVDPCTVSGRVARGGSFYAGADPVSSSANRQDYPATFRLDLIGFRCARDSVA